MTGGRDQSRLTRASRRGDPPLCETVTLRVGRAHTGAMSGPTSDDLDPGDLDPDERDLKRRSSNPSLSPWIILLGLGLLGVIAFMAFAVLTPG